ncbi:MAG: hypothetical protein ACREOI_08620 [bacterium]
MKDSKAVWIAILLVVVHGLIGTGHLFAHGELGVETSAMQNLFIVVVIGFSPIAAAVLLWTSSTRKGFLLLAASMAGSLLFGVYFHYIAISPDHVSHLPAGESQGLFRFTAMLLAMMEVLGAGFGWWGFRRIAT